MAKRGMSAIVITIILVALTLVAIGIVWVVISGVLSEGLKDISLKGLKINLKIKAVKIQDNNLSVQIERKTGEGNLSGIKFLIYDGDNTHSFEESNINFKELEVKTFYIDYSGTIKEISIAPIYKTKSGEDKLGNILDTYKIGSSSGEGESCTANCECALTTCLGDTCIDLCDGSTCSGTLLPDCNSRECGTSPNGCGNCGTCDSGYSCSNGICVLGCVPDCSGKECGDNGCGGLCGTCTGEEICQNGTCSSEPCTSDCGNRECGNAPNGCGVCGTCDTGYNCIEGYCIKEERINFGTINSVWPSNVGLYFDSEDLPKDGGVYYISFYAKFTTGPEERCIIIEDFMPPIFPEIYNRSHIKLATFSSIQPGNNYEIWQTYEGCIS